MLSRIAESLFWIGRYVERADGTARILDVHLERLNHLPMEEQRSVAQELLAVMGARRAERGTSACPSSSTPSPTTSRAPPPLPVPSAPRGRTPAVPGRPSPPGSGRA